MPKLVVLKLDGDLLDHGCRVTLEIGVENQRPEIEISGNLPPFPDLASCLCQWQNKYCSLRLIKRIKPQEIIYDGCITKQISECRQSANILSKYLQIWLESPEFRSINNTLREELNRDEIIRVLIRTSNFQLQKLTWHLWDFFKRYPLAEFAFSTTDQEKPPTPTPKPKVRILAILVKMKPMNNIELNPRLYTCANHNTNNLIFEIFVDGQELVDFSRYAVDLEEIIKSISHDGEFYIITCHCGVPGCAGIDKGIEVLHTQGLVLWTITQPIPLQTLTFEQKMYENVISNAIKQGKQLMAQAMYTCNQKAEVVPMQNARLLAIK